MADYGLSVKNAGGKVVIDSSYKNYSVTEYGSKALTSGVLTNLDITNTPDNILCALQPTTSGYSGVYSYVKSGVNYTDIKLISDASQTVPYLVYKDTPSQSTSTGYGLVVYNDSGDPTFSSNEIGYCNLVATYRAQTYWSFVIGEACTEAALLASPDEITVEDADNNYFLVISREMMAAICPTNNIGLYSTAIKKVDSNTIKVKLIHAHTYTDTSVSTTIGLGVKLSFANPYILEVRKPPSI